jgi:hypothetical protein
MPDDTISAGTPVDPAAGVTLAPSAAEVARLADKLHNSGIINLDMPVRQYLDQLRELSPNFSVNPNMYCFAWSHFVFICY